MKMLRWCIAIESQICKQSSNYTSIEWQTEFKVIFLNVFCQDSQRRRRSLDKLRLELPDDAGIRCVHDSLLWWACVCAYASRFSHKLRTMPPHLISFHIEVSGSSFGSGLPAPRLLTKPYGQFLHKPSMLSRFRTLYVVDEAYFKIHVSA